MREHSEPEPGLAVVAGAPRDATDEHPSTAALVVEVADSTLRFDRTVKASLYAQAGILDYWIVNLVDRVLEIHRDPGPMAEQPFGHHYRSVTRHPAPATVEALRAPDTAIAVADLLP